MYAAVTALRAPTTLTSSPTVKVYEAALNIRDSDSAMRTRSALPFLLLFLLLPLFLLLYLVTSSEGACQLSTRMELNENTLELKFAISNIGKTPVCVLKWYTILENAIWWSPFDVYKEPGEEFIKPLQPTVPFRWNLPAEIDYLYLKPGAEHSPHSRDLKQAFPFQAGSQYSFLLKTQPLDCYEPEANKGCIKKRQPDAWKLAKMVRTHKNTLGMNMEYPPKGGSPWRVTKKALGGFPKGPKVSNSAWLEKHREEIQISGTYWRSGAVTGVNFPSEDEFKEVANAHKLAVEWFGAAIKYDQVLFNRWFGKYNQKCHKDVKMYFEECAAKVKEHFVYFFLPNQLNQKDWIAHVDSSLHGKEQHFVNVHKLFFDKKQEEQVVTLVHEVTHDIMGTLDIPKAYGEELCKKLARSYPKKAAVNAENFAYYARDAYKKYLKAQLQVTKKKTKRRPKKTTTPPKKDLKRKREGGGEELTQRKKKITKI